MSQFNAYSVLCGYAELQQLSGCREELGTNQDLRVERKCTETTSTVGEESHGFIAEHECHLCMDGYFSMDFKYGIGLPLISRDICLAYLAQRN